MAPFGSWPSAARATALALALAGCASAPPTSFDLSAARPMLQRAPRATIRVREPTATADLDGARILVRSGDNSLSVLAGAQWADRLPLLLRSRLTQSFENAHGLKIVGEGGAANFDYDLETDVRAFELDADARDVKIDFAVKLVSLRGGRVVAARIFERRAPVASTEPGAVTAALDAALSDVMVEIVRFAASSL